MYMHVRRTPLKSKQILQNEEVQPGHNISNKFKFKDLCKSNIHWSCTMTRVEFQNSFVLNLSHAMLGLPA